MRKLITNIASIYGILNPTIKWKAGKEMSTLENLTDAWLLIDDDLIAGYGSGEYPGEETNKGTSSSSGENRQVGIDQTIDADGGTLLPAFCDSHTHLVYAGSREDEYTHKIMGLSYEQIARKGGGILNSAKLLQETSEEELFRQSVERAHEIISLGTGAVEIKSGYGLTTKDEIKMLRVARRIGQETPLTVKTTFLGAHSYPLEYRDRRDQYVDLIIKEMLPAVAAEQLADYIDVFCDRGFFTPEQTGRILEAGAAYGLPPKIHANELDYSGGIQTGVQNNARSVDHLEFTGEEEIAALLDSNTMPTLLPGASLFLGMEYAPAREMIDAGLPVALASDFNPGSSPSGNMKLVMSLAMMQMKMLPAEVINAATINGAYAMGLEETHGSVTKGKVANLVITHRIPGINFVPYAYGSDLIAKVILNGEVIKG